MTSALILLGGAALTNCADGLTEPAEVKAVANAASFGSYAGSCGDNDDDADRYFTTIDFPGTSNSYVWGIGSQGDIVGAYVTPFTTKPVFGLPPHVFFPYPAHTHGFVRSGRAGGGEGDISPGSFRSFDFPEAVHTAPYAMNPAGSIVGAYAFADGVAHGFLLNKLVFTTIDFPGAPSTTAWGINSAGDIVGLYAESYSADTDFQGFLLSDGKFTSIEVPGSSITWPRGINAAGEIVGFTRVKGATFHGFLLKEGVFTSIYFPGARSTLVLANNDCGDIVGRYSGGHGFLLRGRHFTLIDVPGAVSTTPLGVNPREIVGQYENPDGSTHGFSLRSKKKGKEESEK